MFSVPSSAVGSGYVLLCSTERESKTGFRCPSRNQAEGSGSLCSLDVAPVGGSYGSLCPKDSERLTLWVLATVSVHIVWSSGVLSFTALKGQASG